MLVMGVSMRRLPVPVAVVAASLVMLLGLVAFMPGSAEARSCGTVTFKQDPYGSGGQVSAQGISCSKARRIAANYGRKGIKPPGWSARLITMKGMFVMKKGNMVIRVQIAGATPPGIR